MDVACEHWEIVLFALVLFRYVYPAHTDYVPAELWQDLLSRYMHLVQHPDPNAPFRGSLVDENVFSIDMKNWGLENLLAQSRERELQKSAPRVPSLGVVRGSGT